MSQASSFVILMVTIFCVLAIFQFYIQANYNPGQEIIGGIFSFSRCKDSDSGINYFIQGTCTASGKSYTDYCTGNTLTEYYCSGRSCKSKNYVCPNGCSNGACIQISGGTITTTTTSTITTTSPATTSTTTTTTSTTTTTIITYPAGVYNITINAYGQYAGGAWPNMVLVLDKTLNVITWTVASSTYQSYSVLVNIPDGTHEIGVAYTNDFWNSTTGEDRNLYVQYVAINGLQKFSSDSGVVYDRDNGDGSLSTYFDGINTMPGQSEMAWEGALRFENIPFPAASPVISVDYGNAIGTDVLSIATQRQYDYPSDSLFVSQTKNLGMKMIRLTSYDLPNPYGPCTQWNVATHSCSSYNWNAMDTQLRFVVNTLGAVPLIRVGTSENFYWVPSGMPLNNSYADVTFPAQSDYAQYFADIAKHITVDLGISPVYLEVINEPDIGSGTNGTKEYLDLYATTRSKTVSILNGSGKSVGKDALLGINYIDAVVWGDAGGVPFFNYLINSSQYVDFGSVHMYSAWGNGMYPDNTSNYNNVFYPPNDANGYYTDGSIIRNTYDWTQVGSETQISFAQIKNGWQQKWGVPLHLFNTEGNLNSVWINGTDFRQQNLLSALVHAIMLKDYAINGFDYYTFYQQTGWDMNTPTVKYGGWGFGIMNSSSPYNPYAPYWTAYLWSNYFPNQSAIYSINVNDYFSRVDAFSVSTATSKNILLLNKVDAPITVTVQISGFSPSSAIMYVLDKNSYDQHYDSSCDCTKITKNGISTVQLPASSAQTVTLDGYTVAVIVLK